MAATRSKMHVAELSRVVDTTHWQGSPLNIEVDSSADERRRLAARFALQDIESLRGEARLERMDDDDEFRLRGRLVAEVVQTCVVTLEPIRARVDEEFERRFSSATEAADDGYLAVDGDDPPDPLVNGMIDVGEVMAEELGLALDPYPRLPGASLNIETKGESAPGPFDRLRKLRAEGTGASNASTPHAASRRPTRS